MSVMFENKKIYIHSNSTHEWEILFEDRLPNHDSCVIEVSDSIYIIGGHNKYCSNSVLKLENLNIIECTPMLSSRSNCSGIYFEGKIYVIGGINTDSKEALISCEVFHISEGKWSTLPHMNYARIKPSVCTNNNWIYAVGGIGIEIIERYHTDLRYWQVEELRLFQASTHLALVNVDINKIMILGGKDERNSEISSVWQYDFHVNSMLEQASLSEPCAVYGFSAKNEKIFLYGRKKVIEYQISSAENHTNKSNITYTNESLINYHKHKPKNIKFKLPEKVHVLVIKKLSVESSLDEYYLKSINYLYHKNCAVYVETLSTHHNEEILFTQDHASIINLIVLLGGDGTIIWVTKLFRNIPIPPIIAFNFGSLGFMTTFPAKNVVEVLDSIFSLETVSLEIYSRLSYVIRDSDTVLLGECTNEICVDRGSNGNLVELEVYLNEVYCTVAVGDGLIIATPCGSTAYSLSAGGSIVHHAVPSMLITPICPHSLSFRPLIVPESVTIRVKIPHNARNSAWVNIDGATKHKLGIGASLEIKISEFCIPCTFYLDIVLEDAYFSWISRIRDILGWNDRRRQKIIKSKPSL